jgi:hypothetical protein
MTCHDLLHSCLVHVIASNGLTGIEVWVPIGHSDKPYIQLILIVDQRPAFSPSSCLQT